MAGWFSRSVNKKAKFKTNTIHLMSVFPSSSKSCQLSCVCVGVCVSFCGTKRTEAVLVSGSSIVNESFFFLVLSLNIVYHSYINIFQLYITFHPFFVFLFFFSP